MIKIPQENIRAASEGLRAIAHEIRLSVLCHLIEGPKSVKELVAATDASQSNLSQHLAKMRMMGIILNEKNGQSVIYRIAKPEFSSLVEALCRIYCPEIYSSHK